MRVAAALSCLLFLSLAARLAAQQYGLRTYGPEDGLPSASVNALCEDAQGALWIGTDAGAARTNGLRVELFGVREGLPNEEVTALHAAPDGSVWMGCRNGAVVHWKRGAPIRVLSVGSPSRTAVRAFASTPDGTLWMGTLGTGVLRVQQEGLPAPDLRVGLPAMVRTLVTDVHGRLLAGTDSGLYVARAQAWQRIAISAVAAQQQVLAIHADAQGVIVGTQAGFVELDTALVPLPPWSRFAGVFPLVLPDPRVLAVTRVRNGDLWVGTPSGLVHLSRRGGPPRMRVIREANGLGHDVVRAVMQDRSGAVWAATAFGGVGKFTGDAFMHYTERDGLRSRIVSAIHRVPDGRLWIGSVGGGMALVNEQGSLVQFGPEQGLMDPMVICIGEDAEGNLLVGTATGGLFRLEGDRFRRVPLGEGAAALRVFDVHLDGASRCWVATDKGLFELLPHGGHRKVLGGALQPTALVHAGDTLFVASDRGLWKVFTHQEPLLLIPHTALPTVPLTSVVRDLAGTLWLGSEGHGLYRLNGTRVDSLGIAQGLRSMSVEQVLLDAHHNLWLGTRRGVHQVELDALQDRVIAVRAYGLEEGFLALESFRNACWLDLDSALWFGTVRGATRFQPGRELVDTVPPSLQFTDLQLLFEHPDWSRWCTALDADGMPQELVLPYDRNHLTFAFTGISLAYPEKVRYRFILEGYDPDWSPITSSDKVTYSNIPPGTYTFRVMARNASGIWTEDTLDFSFTVRPPFWATVKFRAAAGTLLLLLLLGVVRMREQRAQRERQRLEGMVQERTHQLATEKERSDQLLLNILPASTAEELKAKGAAEPRSHPECTVLFSDFTGFTSFSGRMDKETLVAELDHYFRLFDRLCDRHGVEKIKTIGDAYMCAVGLPAERPSHALDAVLMALGMVDAVARSNAERRAKGRQEWPVRIGLHSGPVISGVVGEKKFAYDIWGDTVNLASRMESNSEPGRINISGTTYARVLDYVEVQPRGPVKVKGKGELHMYYVLRLKPRWSADAGGFQPNGDLLAERERLNA